MMLYLIKKFWEICQISIPFMLFIFLEGCYPVYKISYTYHPLSTTKNKACADHCFEDKEKAQLFCLETERHCQQNTNRLAVASNLIYQSTDYLARTEIAADCRKQADRCEWSAEQAHQLCHEACGGEVTTQTSCIKNCP